jgi:hypothetical protein
MRANDVGCRRTGGDVERTKSMEEVITTKKGNFGRIQVTIPMVAKETMMTWCKKSGMGKAEFFRVALMMGVIDLANQVNAKELSFVQGQTLNINPHTKSGVAMGYMR